MRRSQIISCPLLFQLHTFSPQSALMIALPCSVPMLCMSLFSQYYDHTLGLLVGAWLVRSITADIAWAQSLVRVNRYLSVWKISSTSVIESPIFLITLNMPLCTLDTCKLPDKYFCAEFLFFFCTFFFCQECMSVLAATCMHQESRVKFILSQLPMMLFPSFISLLRIILSPALYCLAKSCNLNFLLVGWWSCDMLLLALLPSLRVRVSSGSCISPSIFLRIDMCLVYFFELFLSHISQKLCIVGEWCWAALR